MQLGKQKLGKVTMARDPKEGNVRSGTLIYPENRIGDYFQTGHYVVIRGNNDIGNNVSVGTGTEIAHDVEIGNNVRIHSQCFIPEFTIIKDWCWLGPRVCITNCKLPNEKIAEINGVTLEEGVIIGANATIGPGLTIGEHSLIGAGAVVTKNIPPMEVWVGNPARFLRKVTEDELKRRKSTRE